MKLLLKKRILNYSLILIAVLVASCGGDQDKESVVESNAPFPEFTAFPNALFLDLSFDMETNLGRTRLAENGFELREGSVSNYYRSADSTEVVLPDEARISSLKIFLHGSKFLTGSDNLLAFFSESAVSESSSGNYTVFEFETNDQKFKLDCFIQAESIRITSTLIHRG